jgi:hypothetical protein
LQPALTDACLLSNQFQRKKDSPRPTRPDLRGSDNQAFSQAFDAPSRGGDGSFNLGSDVKLLMVAPSHEHRDGVLGGPWFIDRLRERSDNR